MSRTDFDWYETELVKRFSISMVVALLIIFCTLIVLVFIGHSSVSAIIILLVLCLMALVIGAYIGLRDVRKRDPTQVGLSANGIRLVYHDQHHEDILWNHVDGIFVGGLSNHPGIIHKDGSVTTVVVPKNIITEMEKRFQEMRIATKRVGPKEIDKAAETFKAKKKRKKKDRGMPGEKEAQQIKMQAKYQGTCLKCGIGIFPRQMIVKDGEGWIHERCADSETEKEIVPCTCGHSKKGHVKRVCMAGGCSCRGFKKEAIY